ncbi:hypothetical protein Pelo_12672 [Pelomyxa schiedti]|nr:hypothetical protein Pelo_12672 [Pelomyxa schiedti]
MFKGKKNNKNNKKGGKKSSHTEKNNNSKVAQQQPMGNGHAASKPNKNDNSSAGSVNANVPVVAAAEGSTIAATSTSPLVPPAPKRDLAKEMEEMAEALQALRLKNEEAEAQVRAAQENADKLVAVYEAKLDSASSGRAQALTEMEERHKRELMASDEAHAVEMNELREAMEVQRQRQEAKCAEAQGRVQELEAQLCVQGERLRGARSKVRALVERENETAKVLCEVRDEMEKAATGASFIGRTRAYKSTADTNVLNPMPIVDHV